MEGAGHKPFQKITWSRFERPSPQHMAYLRIWPLLLLRCILMGRWVLEPLASLSQYLHRRTNQHHPNCWPRCCRCQLCYELGVVHSRVGVILLPMQRDLQVPSSIPTPVSPVYHVRYHSSVKQSLRTNKSSLFIFYSKTYEHVLSTVYSKDTPSTVSQYELTEVFITTGRRFCGSS